MAAIFEGVYLSDYVVRYSHSHAHLFARKCTHTRTHAHTHARRHAHTHAQNCISTFMIAHVYEHAPLCMLARSHANTYVSSCLLTHPSPSLLSGWQVLQVQLRSDGCYDACLPASGRPILVSACALSGESFCPHRYSHAAWMSTRALVLGGCYSELLLGYE